MYYSQELVSATNHASTFLRSQLFKSSIKMRPIRWNSDFVHSENWKVIPIYLNYEWAKNEMRTFDHPLASMGIGIFTEWLNHNCKELYPNALPFLDKFIATNLVNYIGISILPANTTLNEHVHYNIGNVKLHTAIYIPPACGISCDSMIGRTRVHYWKNENDHFFFDDNYSHYAWNHSSFDRYVLIVDFNSEMIIDLPGV
tara:strand:+ start:569 stop:1168 length:600 start_codon:yes stop_codon:yes gene_type:complete